MRLFVAAPVPASARDDLRAAIADVAGDDRLSWTRPEGWHVTVAFVGEVPTPEPVVAGVRDGAVGDAVTVTTGPVHTLARGTALVVGLEDTPEGALERLGDRVQRALAAAEVDVRVRPVRPHLTLGRARRGRRVPPELRELVVPTTSWTVDRLEVVESVLGRGPATYRARASVPLGRSG